MSTSAEAPIGVIAHYNLLELLDRSGPGELYRARDTHAGRTVALRLLPADFTPDTAGKANVIDTARRLGALSHPNIIAIFDAGEHEGRVYVAFEFVKGQSLRAELGGRPMNVRRAVELATQLAGAVADTHAAGLACRGLSPDSIVVTAKGLAKVSTFELAAREGLARTEGEARLHDYESPEEARGEPADERSDTYSVGAVLFEMLTARRPSPRGAAAPSATNPNVPRELDEVVLKAIAPNAERRYQNAATLVAELRGVATGEVRGPRTVPEPPSTRPAGVSHMTLIAMLVVLVAAAWVAWRLL